MILGYRTVIRSRFQMFWWEHVIMVEGRIVQCCGQFRCAEAAWADVRAEL